MIIGWYRVGLSLKQRVNSGVERSASMTVLVETDDNVLTREQILNHPECPLAWQQHPLDPDCFAKSLVFNDDPMNSVKTLIFEYDNTYENNGNLPNGGPLKFEPNPILRPAEISSSTYAVTEDFTVDMDGKKVENTAGEKMLTTAEFHYQSFHVVKHLPKPFGLSNAALLPDNPETPGNISSGQFSVDFINSDNVTIKGTKFNPGTLWATNFVETSYRIEGPYVYYTLAYDIRHNPNGWHKWMLNAGYCEKRRFASFYQIGNASNVIELEDTTIEPPGFNLSQAKILKGMRRIRIGPEGAEFPRQPVPLDTEGRAFRDSTGAVVSPDTGSLEGYAPFLKKFRVYRNLQFNGNLPL